MINITYFLLEFPIDFCRTVGPKFFLLKQKSDWKKVQRSTYSVYKHIISDHDCYLANFTYVMRTHGIPTFRTPPKCGQIIFGIAFQYF